MYRGHLKVPRREGELGFQSSADQRRYRQLFIPGGHPVIPEFNPSGSQAKLRTCRDTTAQTVK
jgi:hypothetical protein